MKVNFAQVLEQLDGTPITGENNAPFTLSMCAVNALLQPTTQTIPPIEKVRRARVAERVYEAGEIDISPEDIVLIRECIGVWYPPLIVMKAYRLLGDDDGKITVMKVV